MRKETEEKVYDVRLILRNFQSGQLLPGEYEKYLKSLKDCSDNMEELDLTDEGKPEESEVTEAVSGESVPPEEITL